MYYEINVSKNGKHVFATAERSITARFEFDLLWLLFNIKFPESEGYDLQGTRWQKSGEVIKETKRLKKIPRFLEGGSHD